MPTDLAKIFPNFEPLPRIHGGIADSTDVNITRLHLEKFALDFMSYFIREITALNENLPCKTIDVGEFCDRVDELFADHIGGPLMRIAERLDEDETESRGPQGSYLRVCGND